MKSEAEPSWFEEPNLATPRLPWNLRAWTITFLSFAMVILADFIAGLWVGSLLLKVFGF